VLVSFEFLRWTLGIIGVGCAFMAGRSFVAVRKGWLKTTKLYGWVLRAVVCLSVPVYRFGIDRLFIIFWIASLAAFLAAYWHTAHQKPPEDLSEEIFPHEQ
jgi:hypothetical protein